MEGHKFTKCIVTFTEIAAKSEVVAQIPIKTTRAAGNNLFKDSSIEGLLKLRVNQFQDIQGKYGLSLSLMQVKHMTSLVNY